MKQENASNASIEEEFKKATGHNMGDFKVIRLRLGGEIKGRGTFQFVDDIEEAIKKAGYGFLRSLYGSSNPNVIIVSTAPEEALTKMAHDNLPAGMVLTEVKELEASPVDSAPALYYASPKLKL